MIPVPKGYTFSTAKANFRYKNRDDLGLILSEKPAVVAAVFTTNKFKAAPIYVCQKKLKQNSYKAQGIVINSGIANAGTGEMGIYNCN
ncbi:bifunctional ornithine acetyltransferase/N-acetylglutamate synthase, partial [Desulfothermus sp.]